MAGAFLFPARALRWDTIIAVQQQLPASLVYAVQDLYDLYQRHAPGGPYRHGLFGEASGSGQAQLPGAASSRLAHANELARGVSCLLAASLPAAALATTAALWSAVRALERELAGDGYCEPEYYAFLSSELEREAGPGALATAYRLFGEVLAVLLDVCAHHLGADDAALPQRVAKLRRGLDG